MSVWHLLILAVVVVLVFGTGKLSKIGPDLGNAIRGFKKNLNGDDDEFRRREAEQLRVDARTSSSTESEQGQPVNAESR